MKRVAAYLKVLLPFAAFVALYFIAPSFLKPLTQYISDNKGQAELTTYYPNYDLSKTKTIKGSMLSPEFDTFSASVC